MRRKIFAVLTVMSLLIIGSLLNVPGIFAHDEEEDKVESKVGVLVFRVPDTDTPGGKPAPNVGDLVEDAKFELERTAAGVSMELKTSGLLPGAYTIWWAIDNDNNPETGMDPGDAVIVNVEVVRIATGGIVGANGKGKFKATLPAAPFPPANKATSPLNIATVDFDPMGAGIALVIRYHGPVIPGAVNEQTTLFGGGCSNAFLLAGPSPFPGAFLAGNVCFDPQATEFARP